MNFKNKYLKYKSKYLNLKNLVGGEIITGNINKTTDINRILGSLLVA